MRCARRIGTALKAKENAAADIPVDDAGPRMLLVAGDRAGRVVAQAGSDRRSDRGAALVRPTITASNSQRSLPLIGCELLATSWNSTA